MSEQDKLALAKDAKRDFLIGQWRELNGDDMPAHELGLVNMILDRGQTPYLAGLEHYGKGGE